MISALLAATAAGFLFGLSLIVAIGAQNTFVLQTGLRREHVLAVVGLCAASDVVLIVAGVAGAGAALQGRPWLLDTVRVIGAIFLFAYAGLAARRALRPARAPSDVGGSSRSLRAVVGTALALTWLNPGVYLDTVVLLGSVANTHHGQAWWFASGAALASLIWFFGIGYGSRLLRGLFTRPVTWRALDGFVAVTMVTTGLRILLAG
jgi:L-lysine exporter family protein LysE/ArgO